MGSINPITDRTDFYLFGYPISHSASPALHNTIFQTQGLAHHYSLHDTKSIDDPDSRIREIVRSPTFGGAAITMPVKVGVIQLLDRLSDAVKEIGSVNTIVVKTKPEDGSAELVGENFDWMGISECVRNVLGEERMGLEKPFGEGRSGFIIGGGGTCRAAVYALTQFGLSPIYIVNRDPEETAVILKQFPKERGYDLRPLTSVGEWGEQEATTCAMGIGAIPCASPETEGEKMVYAVAERIFMMRKEESPYLEMCYKPKRTLLFEMAEKAGWTVIPGIESMIQQALSQQQAWLFDSAASPYTAEQKKEGLKPEAISKAAELARAMGDKK
ncbi:hypothetical protein MNV49_002304 [Pseudohyphozyma bogoriensis]|nr:hypothetical protein MNV49_002304 [Pseudohyphozyma bogoriensis]